VKYNCIGIAELLCAYSDGELEDSKRHIVEDHLLICDNCSAILKVYGEISTAIDDTNVEAPEALRLGVMNRVKSEETHFKIEESKERKNYRFALTRFAPIAACLLVGLLIWQPWGRSLDNADADPLSMYGHRQSGTPDAPNPMPASVPSSDDGEAESSDDEGPPSPSSMDNNLSLGEENILGDVNFDLASISRRWEVPVEQMTDEDVEALFEYFSNAYAEITIVGELPVLLTHHEPLQFGSWFDWESVYHISRAEVTTLIEELGNRAGFEIHRNYSNTTSPYALVLYSHGD